MKTVFERFDSVVEGGGANEFFSRFTGKVLKRVQILKNDRTNTFT